MAKEKRLSFLLFLSKSDGFSGFLASSVTNLGYMRQKKIQETHHCAAPLLGSEVPRWPFSLHLPESSYVCLTYRAQDFQLYLEEGIGVSTPFPTKGNSPMYTFKIMLSDFKNWGIY